MKEIVLKLYEFDELSKDSQERIIERERWNIMDKRRSQEKNLKNRSRCGSLARFWNYIYIIIWRMTSLTYGFASRMA